jgi:predicted flavoprotein YhiN
VREAIDAHGAAVLHIDLRPDVTETDLAARLQIPRGKQSLSTWLRKAGGVSPLGIGLMQEAAHRAARRLADLSPRALAAFIKTVPLHLTGVADIARAISSAGGIRFDAVDAHFMLRSKPGVFVAGEMLDWEAPTGGYLLQACFATGRAAGAGAVRWLQRR